MGVFFKQKTAYEMRIRDWSSDVCSSDLSGGGSIAVDGLNPMPSAEMTAQQPSSSLLKSSLSILHWKYSTLSTRSDGPGKVCSKARTSMPLRTAWRNISVPVFPPAPKTARGAASVRSEEHTSELQSLMRLSYA